MSDNTFYSEFVRDMFKAEVACDHVEGQEASRFIDDFGLLHAAVGVAGEAGEVLDAIKKVVFTGKEYDRKVLVKELGDLEFYLQALRNETGITVKEVLDHNVEKLSERHPDGITKSDYYKEFHG